MSQVANLSILVSANVTPAQVGLTQLNGAVNAFTSNVSNKTSSISNMARSWGQSLLAPMALIGGFALKTGADLLAVESGFRAMIGNAEIANAKLAEMRQIARAPGIEYSSAVQGLSNLVNTGLDIGTATAAIKEFGNSMALSGRTGADQLQRLIKALSDIKTQARVQKQELDQLAEAGIPVFKMMNDIWKVRSAEDLNAMGVSADEFIRRITAALSERPRAPESLKNELENTLVSIKETLTGVIKTVEPQIKGFLKWIQETFAWINRWSPATKMLAVRVLEVVAGLILLTRAGAAVGTAWGWLKTAGEALGVVGRGLSRAITWLRATYMAISYVSTRLFTLFTFNASGLTNALKVIVRLIGVNLKFVLQEVWAILTNLMTKNPVGVLLTVIGASVAYIFSLIERIKAEAREAVELPQWVEDYNTQRLRRNVSGMGERQQQLYLDSTAQSIEASKERIKQLQKEAAWWKPGSAIAMGSLEVEKAHLETLKQRHGIIKEIIASRAEEVRQQDEARRKAREESVAEEKNKYALDLHVLEVRLSKDKWTAERAAAKAEFDKRMYELKKLADAGEQVTTRQKIAKAELDLSMKDINSRQKSEETSTAEAKNTKESNRRRRLLGDSYDLAIASAEASGIESFEARMLPAKKEFALKSLELGELAKQGENVSTAFAAATMQYFAAAKNAKADIAKAQEDKAKQDRQILEDNYSRLQDEYGIRQDIAAISGKMNTSDSSVRSAIETAANLKKELFELSNRESLGENVTSKRELAKLQAGLEITDLLNSRKKEQDTSRFEQVGWTDVSSSWERAMELAQKTGAPDVQSAQLDESKKHSNLLASVVDELRKLGVAIPKDTRGLI